MLAAALLLVAAQNPLSLGERVGGEGEVTSLSLSSFQYTPGLLLGAVEDPEEPSPLDELSQVAPVEPATPVAPALPRKDRDLQAKLAIGTLSAFGMALAITTGIGSVVDQNGDFGRVSAVAATSFGIGSVSFAITTAAVTAVLLAASFKEETFAKGLAAFLLSPVFGLLAGMIVGTVGLVVGGFVGAELAQQPGVPRATLGVVTSSMLGAVSISLMGLAIAID
ncbi:MAG: hypothetical protein JNM17_07925 [Archangium sp.]|nr:hypothetical protein [Archangium sp.]